MRRRKSELFVLRGACCGLALLAGWCASASDAAPSELEAFTARMSAGMPVTLASFGDSITWPCYHTDFRRNYLTLTADALRQAYPAAKITLVHAGNMGTAARGLNNDRFDRHVLARRPDVVFLMFGMNDCLGGQAGLEAYDRNLTNLIRKTREAGSLPVVCTQNEILYDTPDGKLRQTLPLYLTRALEVARREGAPAVDCFARWKVLSAAPDSLVARLNDAIHPNLAGHRLFARDIVAALWPAAARFVTGDVRSPVAEFADRLACLLPGPAGKQVVRTGDGTWLALTGRRHGERITELIVSFTQQDRPEWDDFRHVTLIGQGPTAVFDHSERTLTAGLLLEQQGKVYVVLSSNVGVFFVSLDTTDPDWTAKIERPGTWLRHTTEPFPRPTVILNGQQDGRLLHDAFVAKDGGLAVICKHFELAPGAGWEVLEGKELLALATRSADGQSHVQALPAAVTLEAPARPVVAYFPPLGKLAELLAVLSDKEGRIEFAILPLTK